MMKHYKMLVVATMCAGLLGGYARAEGDATSSDKPSEMKEKHDAERAAYREAHKAEWDAFREKQKAGNQEFKKSLEGVTGNARIDAVIKHREEEFAERLAFKKTQHDGMVAEMTAKLDAQEGMTPEKKAECLAKAEARYQEQVTRATEKNDEALAKLKAIKEDTSLSDEQKDAALKTLWQDAREKRKEMKDGKDADEGDAAGDSKKTE
jgi:hypothetical protein